MRWAPPAVIPAVRFWIRRALVFGTAIGLGGALLVALALSGTCFLQAGLTPDPLVRVVARGSHPAVQVIASYLSEEEEPWVGFMVRIDVPRGQSDLTYRVRSSEEDLPRWDGRIRGDPGGAVYVDLGGVITLHGGAEAEAKRLTRTLTVSVRGDKGEYLSEFREARFSPLEPKQILERVARRWLCPAP